jgi:hypothetical protein
MEQHLRRGLYVERGRQGGLWSINDDASYSLAAWGRCNIACRYHGNCCGHY